MIELLRGHLVKNTKLIELLGNKEAIYYLEKPEKLEVTDYIILKDKLISDKYIATYQIEFRVYSKDLNKILDIEKELITYLNDPRGEVIIKDNNNYIRNISVLNGGGTVKTEEGDWFKIIFFLLKK